MFSAAELGPLSCDKCAHSSDQKAPQTTETGPHYYYYLMVRNLPSHDSSVSAPWKEGINSDKM